MLQPLFGENAPACRDLTATSRAANKIANRLLAMCHGPARQEKNTDAGDATHTNQFRRDMNILWKSFDLSSNDTSFVVKDRSRAEICCVFESSFAQA
ncbi:hypothetical protein ABIF50_004330 [Bradyrhizobium diazoefficiens]|jgi:hypothetical protein